MRVLSSALLTSLLFLLGCGPNTSRTTTHSTEGLSREQAGKTTFTLVIQSADWLFPSAAQGSGVIIDERDGYLLAVTNLHNLGLDQLAGRWFQRDLTRFDASVVYHNQTMGQVQEFGMIHPYLDLAFLSIPKGEARLGREYEIAVIDDTLDVRPGDPVLAIGSPVGLPNTFTRGYLSAIRDEPLTEDVSLRYLQTDAALNPGNSGGPLFYEEDDRYFWIGVNTFIRIDTEGLNFAIHYSGLSLGEPAWYPISPEGATDAVAVFKELE